MTSAIARWKSQVEAHHEQSIRSQRASSWSSADTWRGLIHLFDVDPRRTDDPVLRRMQRDVGPTTTVLDVGGGAGRYALPLAQSCAHVTVVEPSESMAQRLRERAGELGITNVSVSQTTWEEAAVEAADVVLCAHVVYGVTEIERFIRKLHAHARKHVLLPAFTESPLAQLGSFWHRVHGEERINLPALPELLPVLWEMDIYPDLEMFAPTNPEEAESWEAAQGLLRHFMFVKPDTPHDDRLQAVMRELVVQTPQGFAMRESRPRRQALLSWRPG